MHTDAEHSTKKTDGNTEPGGSHDARTLAAAILDGAQGHGDTSFVFASEAYPLSTTVADLVSDASRLAAKLAARGIGPGDVVAVQLPNWYQGAIAQAAVALTGATVLPIVHIYGTKELSFILAESGARAWFLPEQLRSRRMVDMIDELPAATRPELIVVVGERAPTGAVTWDEFLQGESDEFALPAIDPSAIALLVYTSGTTGSPKGVQHTHTSLLAELNSAMNRDAPRPGVKHLALFPSGHVAGLLGLLRVLVLGCPTVTMDAWDTDKACRLIDEHQVTYSAGAPIHLAGLLDAKNAGSATLSSMQEFLVGAASVAPSLVERAGREGIVAYRSYGSSEHPTVSAGTIDDPLDRRARTDGRVIPGNEVRIVDPSGADVPTGGDGEVLTRGAELFAGYRNPDLDEESFTADGWFRTGDIGRLDAAGYLTITDRKKDVIIRGGENIASKEVEDILMTHPDIVEAAVVGQPDDRYGERVAAFVVVRAGSTVTVESLAAHFAAAGMAKVKTPEHVELVEELPRTAAGKIQKFPLREQLRTGQRAATDRNEPQRRK